MNKHFEPTWLNIKRWPSCPSAESTVVAASHPSDLHGTGSNIRGGKLKIESLFDLYRLVKGFWIK